MNKMLMAIFNTTPAALKGVIALKDLDRVGEIKLFTTAVITKDPSGNVSIKQASERESKGTVLGMLAGIFLGTLGGPIGLAIGALIGGLAGLIFDLAKAGVSADFLEEVSQALAPGKTTLLAEIAETTTAPVDTKLREFGGHVYWRPRSEFVEDQVLEELGTIEAKLNQP